MPFLFLIMLKDGGCLETVGENPTPKPQSKFPEQHWPLLPVYLISSSFMYLILHL